MLVLHIYPEEIIRTVDKDKITKMLPEPYSVKKKLDTVDIV